MTQEQIFQMQLKQHGLKYALQQQAKRKRWNVVRREEHSACRHCKDQLCCQLCSYNTL